MITGNTSPTPQVQTTTVEGAFLSLYITSLMRLSDTWMNEEKDVSKSRFNLQISFLTALIPDEKVRTDIERERARLAAQYAKTNDVYAEQRAAFVVVSKMITFIVQTFDLTHIDITGATCDTVAEMNMIPPMPADVAVEGKSNA